MNFFTKLFGRWPTLSSNQLGVGGSGEDVAAAFLVSKKYKILATNWCNAKGKRIGEIDIVATSPDGTMVFVEVKARRVSSQKAQGVLPEEAITPGKLHKLQKISQAYIREHDLWNCSWQIDAITVLFIDGQDQPEIKHIQSIFF